MRRRDILRLAALTTMGGAVGLARPLSAPGAGTPPDRGTERIGKTKEFPGRRSARNVIFLVLDGTGYEDLTAARFFSERVLGRPLRMSRLVDEALVGAMLPHSLTSVVTDSAAATSAWATGRKIVNYGLSQFPNGTPLVTILDLARAGGLATGLVATARTTHATPAGWIARTPNRNLEDEIAGQYLDFAPDVLLGGGRGHFDPAVRSDGRDLLGEFAAHGYDVVRTREELLASTGNRLLGLFTPGAEHLPYEVDRRFQGHPAPALSEMTAQALEVLSGSNRGFVLQVEAGRIDHANHQNDPGAMIWDWVAADEALSTLLDFVDRDGETLLIVAADHDTGGGVVYGYGGRYLDSTRAFEMLANRRASHEWLLRRVLGATPSGPEVTAAAREHLGAALSPAGAEAIAGLVAGNRPDDWRWGHANAHSDQPANAIAQILSEQAIGAIEHPNVSFATGSHTAGVVPVILHGAGVTPGGLGLIDNTDLFGVMAGALGLEHENPMLTEAEALEMIATP